MRLAISVLAIVLSTVLATAGAASADEATFDLTGFDSVTVSKGVATVITVGGDFSIRAEGTVEALERADIQVRKGDLRVSRKQKAMNVGHRPQLKVTVTLPKLTGLDLSTGSETTVTGVAADAFSLDVSTGASATVSGECGALSLDVSTGGDLDAAELKCKTASVDASTGGSASIFASERVSGDASFGGDVSVYGSPAQLSKDTSFGGDISLVQ